MGEKKEQKKLDLQARIVFIYMMGYSKWISSSQFSMWNVNKRRIW